MSDSHQPFPGPYGPPPDGPDGPAALLGGPPRDPSWWRRMINALRRWWRSEFPPAPAPQPKPFPMPAPVLIHEDPYEYDFSTPAKGDAFDFKIRVRFDWCSRALATGEHERVAKELELREAVTLQKADVRERIKNIIRPMAREFHPYRPAELEKRLHDEGVCVELNEGELQVHARIRVDADDAVRDAMRPGALERLQMDSDRQTQQQQIAQLRVLRAEWAVLLREALRDMGAVESARTGWMAPYPLALAEKPQNAHGFLTEMLQVRQKNSQDLLNGLSKTINTNQELDVWDVVVKQDSAMRAVMKILGVPVDPPRDDTFGTGEGDPSNVR